MFYEKYIIQVQTYDKDGQLSNALFSDVFDDKIVLFNSPDDAVNSVQNFCFDTQQCTDLFNNVSDSFDIDDNCYIDFLIGKCYLDTDDEAGAKCETMFVGISVPSKPVKVLTYRFEKTVNGYLSDYI